MSNKKIERNLKSLCKKNLKILQENDFDKIYKEIYHSLYNIPTIGDPEVIDSYNKYTLEVLENLKTNVEFKLLLKSIKDEMIEVDNDDFLGFLNTIKKIFSDEKLFEPNNNLKAQIIFFEYDFEPEFSIYGFGKGNYKVIYEPLSFDYNYHDEVFYGITGLYFSKIWKNKTELENLIDELNFDAITNTRFFEAVLGFYKYKIFYLLHKAINALGFELFEKVKTENSLFIYANEHDCEPISIYVFKNKKNIKGYLKNFFTN